MITAANRRRGVSIDTQVSMQAERVAVIGAGPAGLAATRALKRAGLSPDVYDRNPDVGGLWSPTHAGSPVYDSAHFISSKDAPNSTFRDHPFPPGTATYPSHVEVLRYLQDFARTEGLLQHIRLSTAVDRAERVDGGWRVWAGAEPRDYAALVCASGTLWDPIVPDLAGSREFKGVIRHSVTYRSAEEVRGRRVLIVGTGNSAVDIACDIARSAASVSLSARRGYWFVPKFIAGEPTDLFVRRRDALPDWVHPPDMAALLNLLVGAPEAYGLPSPDHAPFASHPIMNSEVLGHLGHGRIAARRSVDRLEGDSVVYSDGLVEQVDEIILATGYRASAPYLPEGTFDYGGGNRPKLWMRLVHPTLPGLYGTGFIETNSSVFRLFDLGGELIARHILAGGTSALTSLNRLIQSGAEPDLSGGLARVESSRHVDYVDSRAYESALGAILVEHLSA